jgi:hypothetical protein
MKAYEVTGTDITRIGYLRPRRAKLADILLVLISSGVAAYAIYELVRTSF